LPHAAPSWPSLSPAERRRARAALSTGAALAEEDTNAGSAWTAQIAAVEAAARRFLTAFSRYESGNLTAAVSRALRRTCTASFAAELLAAPPRPVALPARYALGPRTPMAARPIALDIALDAGPPPAAEVTGTLGRGRAAKPFAFQFVTRPRGWRASGIGD
jgi:hypothetical protein